MKKLSALVILMLLMACNGYSNEIYSQKSDETYVWLKTDQQKIAYVLKWSYDYTIYTNYLGTMEATLVPPVKVPGFYKTVFTLYSNTAMKNRTEAEFGKDILLIQIAIIEIILRENKKFYKGNVKIENIRLAVKRVELIEV